MKYQLSITALDVANHVARLAAQERVVLDPMKLQKVLYYIQCWHLAEKNEPLFPERFKAWVWGPVVPSVWHGVSGNELDPKPDQELDPDQRRLVESVWSALKDLSALQLSDMTHEPETAWRKARGDTPDGVASTAPLNLDDMKREVESRFAAGQKWIADNLDDLRKECA